MKRILCFGDSNTYGYDPRDGGRYEKDVRWVDLIGTAGFEMINEGLNGREIPSCDAEYGYLRSVLRRHGKVDVLILALGVNDAYNMLHPDAKKICNRWREVFLNVKELKQMQEAGSRIILISPPVGPTDMWGGDKAKEVLEALEGMATEYKKFASEEDLYFADANTFGIELATDGVHFTEKGSRTFYENLLRMVEE